MKYRKMGKTGLDVSQLGFGCMRFPTIEDGYESVPVMERPVDEEETEKMIKYALEKGINYFDTAYVYHGGNSEKILGRILKPFRNKVMIATKLPTMLVNDPSDVERFIDEQLERLDTDYVDFYLLHALDSRLWAIAKDSKALNFLDKLKSDGRIRYTGFSFHDEIKVFKEIVDSYDWTMCQIQYNFYDENRQAGRGGLEYAAAKGMGVVVMEPLRGGDLTTLVSPAIREIWDSAEKKRTPAEWGLKWVFNQPEVSLALSGMSAMPQVIENIETAQDASAGGLSDDELAVIHKVKEKYEETLKVGCTGCAYCMPCPNGVNIPINFMFFNDAFLRDDMERSRGQYNRVLSREQRASNCAECGECEEKCPQKIKIMDELKNVHSFLGQ